MSTYGGKRGVDYAWERVRYLTRQLADHLTRRKKTSFEPGDIACCHGSIEKTFYDHLEALQYPLEKWESERRSWKPLRYCVVNSRIGRRYEVFLMTTFGQVRTFDELGVIAHKYGVPVGGMKWFEDIDPINTFPAYFGWEAKSFIFAIPTVVKFVIPAAFPRTPRLVPGELERLREISVDKIRNTRRVHRLVRDSLKYRHLYKFGASSLSLDDEQDDFMPHNDEENDIEWVPPVLKSPSPSTGGHVTPKKILPPSARNDITWVLTYASHDIHNYSTYLNHRGIHCKGPTRLQLQGTNGLPKPYYAPVLRININSISRLLR